jgi:hypothetical protein
MIRSGVLLAGVSFAFGLFFTSCKDDEVPKSTMGFDQVDMEVKESDGTPDSFHPLRFNGATGREITVELKFDRALAETSVIAFTVSGTATPNSTANPVGDFEIVGNDENFTVNKGEDSGEIVIRLFEDFDFEIDDNDNLFETIIIQLTSVVSGTAVIGDDDTFTLTITEDDALIFLDWDDGDGDATSDRGDVDMDVLMHLEGDVVRGSANGGSEDFEAFNVPGAYPNGTYGLSYTYYSGSSSAVEFYSLMYNFGGTLNGQTYHFDNDPLEFVGNYNSDNINQWDDTDNLSGNYVGDPMIVQSMTKNGLNYSNITEIDEPAIGSRTAPSNGSIKFERNGLNRLNDKQTEKLIRLLKLR